MHTVEHWVTRNRLKKLLAWTVMTMEYGINNEKYEGPINETTRGSSYIDMTLSRSIILT